MLIALTGGIGSGKTTVARHWVELGATEIDADLLARQVVEPGTAGLEQVIATFGPGVRSSHGTLDRAELGRIVFDSQDLRLKLEKILHPLIQAEAHKIIANTKGPVVYTIPLFVETNSPLKFDSVVTVSAPQQVRVDRLVRQRGMTSQSADARIAAQASDKQREAVADHVIDSDCTLEELKVRAAAVYHSLLAGQDK